MSGREQQPAASMPCRVLHDAGRVEGEDRWCAAALPGIEFALSHLRSRTMPNLVIPGHNAGTTAEAYLLGSIAWARPDLLDSPEIRALAAKLCACVGHDGCILPPHTTNRGPIRTCSPAWPSSIWPCTASRSGDDLGLDWKTACAWYLQRARLIHPWRLMVWHAQVWNLVADLTGDLGYHEVAIELAEWMAARQLEVDGSFLSGMGTGGPGFDTAFSAEGIAAGWRSRHRAWRRGPGPEVRRVLAGGDGLYGPVALPPGGHLLDGGTGEGARRSPIVAHRVFAPDRLHRPHVAGIGGRHPAAMRMSGAGQAAP